MSTRHHRPSHKRRDTAAPRRPKRPWWQRVLKWGLILGLLGALLAVAGIATIFWHYSRDLPPIFSKADFNPKQMSRIYDRDGNVLRELYEERRTVVELDHIAPIMLQAMVAAEDAKFYEHKGLDTLGMLRAAYTNLRRGSFSQGASTLTQQLVKNLILTPERTIKRKLQEVLLARRLEDAFTKDEILWMYLNYVYFGHGRYGIEEAAQYYFNTSAADLTLMQAATLAGLVQSPERLSPYKHPERSKKRRDYVLGQMLKNGMIDQATHDAAQALPLEPKRIVPESLGEAPYFVEHVRQTLVREFSSDTFTDEEAITYLNTGGLRIHTTIDLNTQAMAERALARGLKEFDTRQKWARPIRKRRKKKKWRAPKTLEPDPLWGHLVRVKVLASDQEQIQVAHGALQGFLDPSSLGNTPRPVAGDILEVELRDAKNSDPTSRVFHIPGDSKRRKASELAAKKFRRTRAGRDGETLPEPPLRPRFRGMYIVTVRKVEASHLIVNLGGLSGLLRMDPVTRVNPEGLPLAELYNVGDQLEVEYAPVTINRGDEKNPRRVTFAFHFARANASLVSIDPKTRHVLALVGGDDYSASSFNRATQAERQTGSSFKPVVFAAALEARAITPATILEDAPKVFHIPGRDEPWSPRNFDNKYKGPMSARRALALSRNTVAVEVLERVGLDQALDLARRIGLTSERTTLVNNYTMALGSSTTTVLEQTNAFATFASGGVYADPIFIERIETPQGDTLYLDQAPPQRVLSQDVSFLITSMMRTVAKRGTAKKYLAKWEHPSVGKTGTTNDAIDAWFVGYTPHAVTGVYVGYDHPWPLGRKEGGGKTALPIWHAFMEAYHQDREPKGYEAPESISRVKIEPAVGKLARPSSKSAKEEFFLPGTEPTEEARPEDELSQEDWTFQEYDDAEEP